jgi:hypothetical protein
MFMPVEGSDRFGSRAAVRIRFTVGPPPGVKPTKTGRKLTLDLEGRLVAGKRPCSNPASYAC